MRGRGVGARWRGGGGSGSRSERERRAGAGGKVRERRETAHAFKGFVIESSNDPVIKRSSFQAIKCSTDQVIN